MRDKAASRGGLVACAVWAEKRWWFYAQQASPYLFGLVCVWLGLSGPQLIEGYAQAGGGYRSVGALLMSAPVYWALSVLALGIVGAQVGANNVERLEEQIRLHNEADEAAKLDGSSTRAALDDAEQHADFIRQRFHELLTRGAASFLKRQTRDVEDFGDHARVSLYAHTDSQFILAGRFTEHPEFIKPNRQRFPDCQGCIGDAWLNGGECYWELPDPVGNHDEYTDALKNKLKINKNTAKSLRMQSSFYYARAITSDNMRVGVIVYESTRDKVLIQEQLGRLVEQDEEHLARIIEQAKFVNPFITIQRGREE